MIDEMNSEIKKVLNERQVTRKCLKVLSSHQAKIDAFELERNEVSTHCNYKTSMINGGKVYWKDLYILPFMERYKNRIIGEAMAEIENSILLKELFDSAGNTITTQCRFSTLGNGPEIVSEAIGLLKLDEVFRYNTIINKAQFYELCVQNPRHLMSDGNIVKRMMEGGSVYKSEIKESTGIVLAHQSEGHTNIVMHNDWNIKRSASMRSVHRIFISFDLEIQLDSEICRLERI